MKFALLILAGMLASSSSFAAKSSGESEARASYQRERAVCLSGKSNQERATCLKEAGAAFDQARREGWRDDSAQNARNEHKRCLTLPDAERKDCLARMQGQGTASGSAAAGGIYRELVTREVGAPVVAPAETEVKPTPTPQ